jgi:hypothetical protein
VGDAPLDPPDPPLACVVPPKEFEHVSTYYVWPLACARQQTLGVHVQENFLFEGRVSAIGMEIYNL